MLCGATLPCRLVQGLTTASCSGKRAASAVTVSAVACNSPRLAPATAQKPQPPLWRAQKPWHWVTASQPVQAMCKPLAPVVGQACNSPCATATSVERVRACCDSQQGALPE